ncbi:Mariner Mos1 transposase [Eumeta japonica]|uniref:Mariner Mos1 transposase n=1 Tax=Eumeta variegata TaxID=151549 RepID=A0A4C1UY09_EUMVA|nr:Mariner Mos1 transposase [Eumeta japonica]
MLNWEVLPYPPYSPDSAQSDYHLFRSMAHALSERRLTSNEDTKNGVDSWIASKDKYFFRLEIRTLPERCKKKVAEYPLTISLLLIEGFQAETALRASSVSTGRRQRPFSHRRSERTATTSEKLRNATKLFHLFNKSLKTMSLGASLRPPAPSAAPADAIMASYSFICAEAALNDRGHGKPIGLA